MSLHDFERFFRHAHKAQRIHADVMDERDVESVATEAKRHGLAFTKELNKQLQREMTPNFAPQGPAGPSGPVPSGMGNSGGGSNTVRRPRQQPRQNNNGDQQGPSQKDDNNDK